MTEKLAPKVQLTERFAAAVTYAAMMHRDQTRKSTAIPYICHPLGVAASVLEAGGDEDQVIAGLLHDVAEDCGGEPRLLEIDVMFGSRVANIVRGCSDSLTEDKDEKAPWRERKLSHLTHLASASNDVVLVTAADKLNNARAIATDFEILGVEVWSRFNANEEEVAWYYRVMYEALQKREVSPVLLKPLASAIRVFSESTTRNIHESQGG